jgi:putative transposase
MKMVCEVLGVVRCAVVAKRVRLSDWRDGRRAHVTDDTGLVEKIQGHVAHLPTMAIDMYGRCCTVINNRPTRRASAQRACIGLCVSTSCCATLTRGDTSDGVTVSLPWTAARCSDGPEFRCDEDTPPRVMFALNCRDWERLTRPRDNRLV